MRLLLAGWVMAVCGVGSAQEAGLRTVEAFPLMDAGRQTDGLVIRRHVEAGEPFTVAGPRGVVLGQQEGIFEAWVLPVKLLSHFTIQAEVEGYPVPIDLNAAASEIEVYPDHTTITYSHIAFRVRQVMYAPDVREAGSGAVVLFQIDSTRAMDLTFRFTPELRPMWPQLGQGNPGAEWVKRGTSGFYVLHSDYAGFAGAVGMPGTTPGILAPYQEKPQVHPLELKLRYEPKRDGARYFPLLMAAGTTAETATTAALEAKLTGEDAELGQRYADHAAGYAKMLGEFTAIRTPDAGLNDAFTWAAVSIEQLKARVQVEAGGPASETGLVAGYYSSGDSARPGFGWFFGRDTLYTLYGVNGFGDFALTREALEFLMRRQRADGKMMHEYSQTAASTAWKELPYMYAAADATPLFLTQMLDYVRTSGDVAFLKAHRAEVEKAWQFETTHDADGDGIYDNSQGTGWVEDWRNHVMPKQEIYLALFDQQASVAMAELARFMGDSATADAAGKRAAAVMEKIEVEYYDAGKDAYGFSRDAGVVDAAATIYPAVAWWSGGAGLKHPEASLRRWASHDFSTDWGTRDVAESDPLYDPISYHMGSVWPLFTGWAAMAEYRAGRTLSGYAHLMQNADMTTSQDLGAVTELLSGAYFQPFGRSTSHQLWSSAMVVVPVLKGMFGIDVDGLRGVVTVAPRLPADWDEAVVERLHVGASVCSLKYKRSGGAMVVRLAGCSARLAGEGKAAADGRSIVFAMPAVEVAIGHGLPLPGARTAQMKVLGQKYEGRSLVLELEGMGVQRLKVRGAKVRVEGGVMVSSAGGDEVEVRFGGGGYGERRVVLRW